jgi:hypothetical protein
MSENGWMNQEITLDFLQSSVSSFNTQKLLVWDAYRCHISEASKARARQLNINMAIIPGGCTGIIQVN